MNSANTYRILLADDHQVVLDGLTMLLQKEDDLNIVGRAQNGSELIDMLRTKDVDLVITDINMPEMDGISSTTSIRKNYPDLRILVLSMHDDSNYITAVLKAGANGYLVKNAGRKEVLKAIRKVINGESYYSPEAAKAVMDNMGSSRNEMPGLSDREKQIVKLICEEFTTREIAEKLFLSFHTVEKHRKNIIAKLDVRNTAGLVKWAIRNGIC
ncbi:MAG: response regulator transcription factor [Bacteroidetes bacterium]|nr:response regulator transcription factor [Bacteroidota bacterium]